MSLAENLLNSLETTNVTNSYSASNEEPHIVVGADRNIIVPQSLRKIAVTGDTGVETVTFDCVRYWDGNDLSTFAIYLNYVLPDRSIGTYIPKSITANDGEDAFHFDWEINRYMTKTNGTIAFSITAIKTKLNENGESVVDKRWSSFPNTECSIVDGIDIANVPDTEETADILSQISAILEEIRDSSVSGGSDSDVPSYWLKELQNGVRSINTEICNAGKNKSSFLFYSDAHWNYGSQMSPRLLKYLYRNTAMKKTFFAGDIVNNEAADYDTMEYLWDWRMQLKDLPNHHSVVGNHDDGNATNNLFSEDYVYGYLIAPEETNDMVIGNGIYYYIDDNCEKTRYLFLDTAYKGVTSDQQEFVKGALIGTPSGWHIVAISHIWYDTDYTTSPPSVGTLNSGASVLLAMFDAYNSRSGEYAECSGWVEFCIGGHTHRDYVGSTTGGIPIILVETDSKHVRNGKNEAQYVYTAGTDTEASVNGIVADYNTNTLHVIRIGRGDSYDVDLSDGVVTEKYSVTYRLENVESSSTVSSVEKGGSYSTTLTATVGTTIKHVIVEMGGSPITTASYNADTGVITIPVVTGAIVITAVAQADTPVEPEEPDTPAYTNLFVKSEAVDGYRLNSSGKLTESSADMVTGFISVQPNTSYTIRCYNPDPNVEKREIGRISEYSTANESNHVKQYRCTNLEHHYENNVVFVFQFTTSAETNFIRCNIPGGYTNYIITLNEPIE